MSQLWGLFTSVWEGDQKVYEDMERDILHIFSNHVTNLMDRARYFVMHAIMLNLISDLTF